MKSKKQFTRRQAIAWSGAALLPGSVLATTGLLGQACGQPACGSSDSLGPDDIFSIAPPSSRPVLFDLSSLQGKANALAQWEAQAAAEENRRGWKHDHYTDFIAWNYSSNCPPDDGKHLSLAYGIGPAPDPVDAEMMAALDAAGIQPLVFGYSGDRRGWSAVVPASRDEIMAALLKWAGLEPGSIRLADDQAIDGRSVALPRYSIHDPKRFDRCATSVTGGGKLQFILKLEDDEQGKAGWYVLDERDERQT